MAPLMPWERPHEEPPDDRAQTDSWPPWALRAWKPPPGAAARVTPPSGADDAAAGRAGRVRQAAPCPPTATARPPDSTTPSEPPANAADSGRAAPGWYGRDRVHDVPSWFDHAPRSRVAGPRPATSSAVTARPAEAIWSTSTSCRASAAGRAGPTADQRAPASRKIPACPARAHAPATSGTPDGL